VFEPSDPDQALRKLHETKNALKVHLFLGHLEMLHANEPDKDEFSFTLADLLDHQIKRSLEHPAVGLFLSSLWHAEKMFLAEESE
jgi:hypothetical protein